MDYERVLATAQRAAREAGQLAVERLGKPGRRKWKGSRDVVTDSTLQVQTRILEIIRQDFPEHPILSEELDDTPDREAEALWLVDPIDGSLNYMQGIPFFAVAIGFWQQGYPRLGVVYDPNRDEMFHAIRRKGAYLNGRSIHTNKVFDGIEAYNAAIVATDWPAAVNLRPIQSKIMDLMAGDVVSLQILGSPALAICYIAANRLHAYYHLQLHLWDVAAALVILEEGGGTFTNALGSAWQYSEGGYVASDGVIHGKVLAPIKLIREAP